MAGLLGRSTRARLGPVQTNPHGSQKSSNKAYGAAVCHAQIGAPVDKSATPYAETSGPAKNLRISGFLRLPPARLAFEDRGYGAAAARGESDSE